MASIYDLPSFNPGEIQHYYFTPREMDARSGKGPGTHDHDSALCGNGSFHFRRTKDKNLVTCPVCRVRLGIPTLSRQPLENRTMKTNYIHPAILTVLRDGPGLFTDRSSYPLPQAQRNLEGRTHYVDDGTLKYFGSRILSCGMTDDKTLLHLIESCKTSADGAGREFRFVIFDVFGTVVQRPTLGKGFKNGEQARRAMWAWLNSFDAQAHYVGVLTRRAAMLEGEAQAMRDALAVVAAERVEVQA